MNLGQLEYPIDKTLAEDLSLSLEEEALSTSWYEAKPEDWIFQVLFEKDQELLIREKITHFFSEKRISLPTMTGHSVENKDWVTAVYRDFPPLTIGRFYVYGSHILEAPPNRPDPLAHRSSHCFWLGST